MKYWVYLNEKVEGPYDNDKLVTLNGFTPNTLICSEQSASSGNQEWVKASTVFEFEQEKPQTDTGSSAMDAADAAALLAKLDTLTKEISNLHSKLDNMETHIDNEFAQSRAQQEATLAAAQAAAKAVPVAPVAPKAPVAPVQNEPTPTPQETLQADPLPQEEPLPADDEAPVLNAEETIGEKTSAEEELVIRSALDSLYNAKLVSEETDTNESTFQDLLTPQQAKDLAAEAKADTPVAQMPEVAAAQPKEQPAPQADPLPQQTPAEAEPQGEDKESLLNELTMAPVEEKNDVLDQIIQERQEEEKSNGFGMAALGAAAIGAAALAAGGEDKREETPADFSADSENKSIDFNEVEEPLAIAPDKNNPDQLETVLPADQMPADVPQAEQSEPEPAPQESLASLGGEEPLSEQQNDQQTEEENTMQELVPGATMEKPEGVLVTDEDLKNAFEERPADTQEDPFATAASVQAEPAANPNDLTEVELKAGSTYLISDFVPPAQADAPVAQENEQEVLDKTNEIQDMLSSQEQQAAPAVDDIAAALEQTTKRGASLDIKTVPMVQEPANSERLKIDGLDDVNAQHDIKAADTKSSGLAKMVVGVLLALVLLIIFYVLLAFMNLIPAQFNLFAKKQAPQAAQVDVTEVLDEVPSAEAPLPAEQVEEAHPAEEPAQNPLDNMLSEVQQFALPNGYTLQAFIEAKHPAVAADLITWDISTAVEPDNYSVLVKVPPENPQSFKTSYRFNYNAVTKTLDPTISDAKNLLDSASGSQLPAGL